MAKVIVKQSESGSPIISWEGEELLEFTEKNEVFLALKAELDRLPLPNSPVNLKYTQV